MNANEVAEQGYKAVMNKKSLYINGRVNRILVVLTKIFPNIIKLSLKRKIQLK